MAEKNLVGEQPEGVVENQADIKGDEMLEEGQANKANIAPLQVAEKECDKNKLAVAEEKASPAPTQLDEKNSGSSIGKFKSVNSLHSAYLDLEKEFTKKSQRLSELEKSLEQDNVKASTPCYQRENWREEVKAFLASNKNALEHASEISDELMKDNNLAYLPNSLELAYAKVLARKYKSPSELIENKEFLESKVLKNEKIKNQIIKEYVESLNLKKTPPVVLSTKGSTVGFNLPQKPANLQEAKALVEKLFF